MSLWKTIKLSNTNCISERYVNIIRRISKETGELTQSESLINKTIKDINDDFVKRNFAGVIRSIELRPLPSNDKLMQLLIEIKNFNDENTFNMGGMDLFSQDSRENVNLRAVKYLNAFSKLLKDEPSRRVLSFLIPLICSSALSKMITTQAG